MGCFRCDEGRLEWWSGLWLLVVQSFRGESIPCILGSSIKPFLNQILVLATNFDPKWVSFILRSFRQFVLPCVFFNTATKSCGL